MAKSQSKRINSNSLKTLCLCALVPLCLLFSSSCVTIHPSRLRGEKVKMVVTAYCSCPKCCGWRRKVFTWPPLRPVHTSGKLKGQRKRVGITADGTKASSRWLWRKGTIAADLSKYPFGTKMYVPGYGWGVVHDIGSAIKGNHIDVFFRSHRTAREWGRQALTVTVIR